MRQRLIQGRRNRAAVAFLVSMPVLGTWCMLYSNSPTIMYIGSAAIVAALVLWALT